MKWALSSLGGFPWLPENGSAHQQVLCKQEVVPRLQVLALLVSPIHLHTFSALWCYQLVLYAFIGLILVQTSLQGSKLWHYKEALFGYMCHSITHFFQNCQKGLALFAISVTYIELYMTYMVCQLCCNDNQLQSIHVHVCVCVCAVLC